MKTDEFDECAWGWSTFESDIQQSDGKQHCFYCDFSLKCGQEECIWRENCA